MIKFAFDTPGSNMRRELSATLTFDVTNNNVTLVLQSTGNSLIAKGTVNNMLIIKTMSFLFIFILKKLYNLDFVRNIQKIR